MSCLEESVQALKEENATLFQILGKAQEGDSQVVSDRADEMDVAANERFVDALKQPHNRVLSDDAVSSLRELFSTH